MQDCAAPHNFINREAAMRPMHDLTLRLSGGVWGTQAGGGVRFRLAETRDGSSVAFEDFRIGETREYGDYAIDEAELLAFAAAYDPQPFHLDAEAAKDTILGGLAASGWHVCSALTRMMIDDWLGDSSVLAGVGIEDNRWLAPVRPGDRLTARTTTVAKNDLRSRPDAGTRHIRHVAARPGAAARS